MLPDGSHLSIRKVAVLAYLELSSGRIDRLYDREKELTNRRDETISLPYPHEHRVATEEGDDRLFELEPCESVKRYCGLQKTDLAKRVTWPAAGAPEKLGLQLKLRKVQE